MMSRLDIHNVKSVSTRHNLHKYDGEYYVALHIEVTADDGSKMTITLYSDDLSIGIVSEK